MLLLKRVTSLPFDHLFFFIVILFILKLVNSSDPTVIFLSNNGARQLTTSQGSQSSPFNGLPFTIQTIARDTVERKSDSSSTSSGVSGGLYSLANVIREKFGERLQDRSSKKGPRIIVIPASTSNNQQVQQQSSQQHQQQQTLLPHQQSIGRASLSPGYSNYVSPGYSGYPPAYVNSPYITSASSSYAQYAIPYATNVQNPYMYSIPSPPGSPMSPSSSSLSSGSRYSAAESAPYASYAHPSTSPTSSFVGSIFPSSLGSILKYPYTSLYPYLAQALAHTLYGTQNNNHY